MAIAQVGKLRMHYEIEGDGPPLLLVTGTGFPGATWRTGISSRFAELGFRVISYDHRGLGQSDKPDGSYSTRMFAQDAVGLLSYLEIEQAHVLGHSMGGRVSQWIALDEPGRVDRLVLAASGPGEIDPKFPVTRGIPLEAGMAMIEKGFEAYIHEHIGGRFFFTDDFVTGGGDVVDKLTKAFWDHRPSVNCYLRHVIARQQHQTTERLGEIDCPTLIIVGSEDKHKGGTGSHVRQSEYLTHGIPNAVMEIISGCAHAFFWQRPDEATRIVSDFLHDKVNRIGLG